MVRFCNFYFNVFLFYQWGVRFSPKSAIKIDNENYLKKEKKEISIKYSQLKIP